MTGLQTDLFSFLHHEDWKQKPNGDTKFFSEIFLREKIYLKFEFYSVRSGLGFSKLKPKLYKW